ncbi:MAG: MarR family transcriptional regulator [Luteitalea sp.]|nr:MarR family transcriptional regulator [Luteitalea sp.]
MSHELCARFHQAVELIGRRWSGAVVQLLLQGPSRYGELRATIPEISDRMLSERLRELEQAGIVLRTVIPEIPVRVEYELTDKGRALQPALDAIGAWAQQWLEGADSQTAHAGRRTRRHPAPAARVITARKRTPRARRG